MVTISKGSHDSRDLIKNNEYWLLGRIARAHACRQGRHMIAACTLRSMIQSPLFFSIESSLFRASDLLKLLADMYLKTVS